MYPFLWDSSRISLEIVLTNNVLVIDWFGQHSPKVTELRFLVLKVSNLFFLVCYNCLAVIWGFQDLGVQHHFWIVYKKHWRRLVHAKFYTGNSRIRKNRSWLQNLPSNIVVLLLVSFLPLDLCAKWTNPVWTKYFERTIGKVRLIKRSFSTW